MSKHHNSRKVCPVIEIIPANKLEFIPWKSKEKFLVLRRANGKLISSGLGEFLRRRDLGKR